MGSGLLQAGPLCGLIPSKSRADTEDEQVANERVSVEKCHLGPALSSRLGQRFWRGGTRPPPGLVYFPVKIERKFNLPHSAFSPYRPAGARLLPTSTAGGAGHGKGGLEDRGAGTTVLGVLWKAL
jgi:hypothetical protein